MEVPCHIHIFLTDLSGIRQTMLLPVPYTLGDFIDNLVKILGEAVCNCRFLTNGVQLDLTNETVFNAQKSLITHGTTIHVLAALRGGCFLSDTYILLSDATKKQITEIRPGDSVLAFTVDGEIVTTSVEEVFIREVDEYAEISAGETILHVTCEHPFFIGDGGFCSIDKLNVNDLIYSVIDGKLHSIPITKKKIITAPGTRVYNFHTADVHTYFANDIAVHNMSGGATFLDLSKTRALVRFQWSSHAPEWRIARPGICFEGKCMNTSCRAYQKEVIINIGLIKFDYLLDLSAETSKCPMCRNFVEPETCAFNNCIWRWEGIKHRQGMAPERDSGAWTRADNAYHRFDKNVSGTVTWRQLIIEATPLRS